jgi:hypothetical protein
MSFEVINLGGGVICVQENAPSVVQVFDTGIKGNKGDAGTNGTNGINGTDGLSAYEVAVENGFVGNEAAWLASLVGAAGTDATPSAGILFGMSGSLISTGNKRKVVVPYACTITRVSLTAKEPSGSMVLDILKNGASICASAKPTLTSADAYSDATLTGWTLTIAAGDVLTWEVESISGITEFDSTLWVDKV